MAARPILLAAALLGLSGCASSQYGYAYCYDPYRGPVGYHYGPLNPPPACARRTAQSAYYLGPHEAGYRGPYVSGPYFAAPDAGRPAAATAQ